MKRVAFITGGSSGIGSEIAVELAKDGFISIINYGRNQLGAEQTLERIKSSGGEGSIIQGDVSSEADVKNMIAKIIEQYQRIDVLVNNAGVFRFGPLESVTKESFDYHFNINVWGTIAVIKEAVKYMDKGSSVINISSINSTNPGPYSILYSASKSAVDSIAKTLTKELGARGIRFNTIAPGGVDTEGNRKAGVVAGSDFEQKMIKATPLNRFGRTDDIAKVASFLASDKAGWVTGERISVAGGLL